MSWPDICVGILAGGSSSRMGTNKALLKIGDERVIEKIAGEFRDRYEVWISAGETGDYEFLGLPVVYDENRGIGPMEGIRRLLIQSREEYVFVCAADMPFIRGEVAEALAGSIGPVTDCVVLTVDGRPEPLCAVYSKSVLPVIEDLIGQKQYKLREIYGRCLVEYVPLESTGLDPGILRNMNTPEDYRQCTEQNREPVHVFLTGERGIGKSVVAEKAAALLGRPCYGFMTRFLSKEHEKSALYMVPAEDPGLMDEAHIVAKWDNGKLRAVPERFDALGSSILQEAKRHPEGIILMDECGHLEKDALAFRQAIRDCLDGEIPVLGVLRKDQSWHNFIIEHPRVQLIEVSAETRDMLPGQIAERLGRTK